MKILARPAPVTADALKTGAERDRSIVVSALGGNQKLGPIPPPAKTEALAVVAVRLRKALRWARTAASAALRFVLRGQPEDIQIRVIQATQSSADRGTDAPSP
jgi:hypothetical protein